ncbi:hypothetical protein H0E87_031715 [Populus deltoides]|uniref:Uncharacterized protein n=1 Tax=Populus deltoides TaxID=3696 RepID=A0A8T2WIJ2_POPDE|nr:hypothetical protein H0E87_031715 [Populus deltoides]
MGAHGNLMPRPRQRELSSQSLSSGGPHQPRQPGPDLRAGAAPPPPGRRGSRRAPSGCQHLGSSTANECPAHAADKQPPRARRLGAGPEDGGRTGSAPPPPDAAASKRARSSCQHLGTSTANECHAHATDKQPPHARRLGAGPKDGGRNRAAGGRKTGGRPERGGPGPEGSPCGREASQQGLPPAAASDAGLAPAAPSLSHAGGRPERGGQGPKAAPAGERQASRGCRPPRPATPGWPLQRLASRTQGQARTRGPGPGRQPRAASKPAGAVACRASDAGLAPAAPLPRSAHGCGRLPLSAAAPAFASPAWRAWLRDLRGGCHCPRQPLFSPA